MTYLYYIKKSTLVSFCLLIITITNCKTAKKENKLNEYNKPYTTNKYIDLHGNTINISDYKGKKVLLNFWATWCKNCRSEIMLFSKNKAFFEKENYILLFVSDQSIDEIKDFKYKNNLKLKFIKYKENFTNLKIHSLPTTFIYNEKGIEVSKNIGVLDLKKLKNTHSNK
ncbi:TlpA family protein disulfide reductase [Tenacibaculum finnmarkense]|uniref:TlpA family protein disulfide reductase n=1 Tax=Tenacibaculum finnmarkense TaxID=2781243 RepID=UPI001E47C068|nr:TlpA disulfide reductase family protein [Tenacibaculum finnmarkense]MCD8443962.1 TlpA family protein disulfide reductase [Tenacibaculum finnmarkense genomovar ulcerans]MCG8786216.1 TlpA family protein disulfide reductase [Tenacibaculum finnmarkense]MCG8794399.1 TlpA family protein disulfide reductase [Tenacibaculum finnmarkense]MCG8796728.1 TlpA family protein disulfide reductase [Tenacibaculum finnmarkense]MCG8813830.1 TlpA family protein disulfide reductase [Tenacibaculum finnmarkense]